MQQLVWGRFTAREGDVCGRRAVQGMDGASIQFSVWEPQSVSLVMSDKAARNREDSCNFGGLVQSAADEVNPGDNWRGCTTSRHHSSATIQVCADLEEHILRPSSSSSPPPSIPSPISSARRSSLPWPSETAKLPAWSVLRRKCVWAYDLSTRNGQLDHKP